MFNRHVARSLFLLHLSCFRAGSEHWARDHQMREGRFFSDGGRGVRWRCRLVFSLDRVDSTGTPELVKQRQFGAFHWLVSSARNDQSAFNMFAPFVRVRFRHNFTLLALSASGIFSS